MKKILLSVFVIAIFSLYAIQLKLNAQDRPAVAIATQAPVFPTPLPTETPTASLVPTPISTSSPAPVRSGKYKDGTYTGSVADAFYGNIQVQAVISGGRITDVIFLQYPNDRQTSIEINSQAMPLLKQEAIQAQSAQVDGVSGATASSGAFIESLDSALKLAV